MLNSYCTGPRTSVTVAVCAVPFVAVQVTLTRSPGEWAATAFRSAVDELTNVSCTLVGAALAFASV